MEHLKVLSKRRTSADATTFSLMVESTTSEAIEAYDEMRITEALVKELSLSPAVASDIAGIVTDRIKRAMVGSESKVIDTHLIRSFVNVVLYEKGISCRMTSNSDIVISTYDVRNLLFSQNRENGNMSHNPESINFTLAERVVKDYVLNHVLPKDIAQAHLNGEIHVHDCGLFMRAYCSSHSLEYLKKHGLKNIPNISSTSAPARHASVLARHLCSATQFFSSIFAGAIGWDAMNIFFAPYLINASEKEMLQLAQTLIFDMSQMSGAKGGQISFTDFNLYLTVPKHYKGTYALFPDTLTCKDNHGPFYKGYIMKDDRSVLEVLNDSETVFYHFKSIEEADKFLANVENAHVITYGDLETVAQTFLNTILQVAYKGDSAGLPFAFPKLLVHVDSDVWENEKAVSLLDFAVKCVAENGSIYFLFDKDDEFSMAQCCRLKVSMREHVSNGTVKDPASVRFVGVQNVSINLPNIAILYKDKESFFRELERRVELAIRAHQVRRDFIKELMSVENSPIVFYKTGMDGNGYVDIDDGSYLVGIVGLNECVYNLCGAEMHQSKDALKLALEIIIYMSNYLKRRSEETGFDLKLEETPAESTASRFAVIDKRRYGSAAFVKENDLGVYYTNSCHFAYDADMNYLERLSKQSIFHKYFTAGSIIHIWVGDRQPNVQSLRRIIEKAAFETDCQQLVFSPELTTCKDCFQTTKGFHALCPICKGDNVEWYTRITGYYSKVSNFNNGKLAELKDRKTLYQVSANPASLL